MQRTKEFRNPDRNEDGSPAIENTRCGHPGCEVYLCHAGCEHLSFTCGACGHRFCSDHKIVFDELSYCLACAVEAVESHEPECECRQTDVNVFDAAGCEFHNPASPWNVRLRAVTAVQEHEAAPQDAASRGECCEF
jgi:hypothetical protein